MKIAFITSICAHYRIKTFEGLSNKADLTYYFYSAGDEWYWEQKNGTNVGNFDFVQLWGVRLGGTRFTPTLIWHLLTKNYDLFIKGINGKFTLPVTYLIARVKRRPFVLWTGIWKRIDTPIHKLFFPIVKYIYQHADAIVVYGAHVRDYLISEGVEPDRIFIAKHSIDNNAYNAPVPETQINDLRSMLQIPDDHAIVLSLGRLVPEKGLEYLLQAFASISSDAPATLIMGGSGIMESDLRQLAGALDIVDRVRFIGYISKEETRHYYALADIFVIPSVTTRMFKEPWGLTVNEAFNQGLPVIATDSVGAAAGGLIVDGKTGFIISERDSEQLSSALHKLISDQSLRETMSVCAKERISNWTNEKMVNGFMFAIESVIENAERSF